MCKWWILTQHPLNLKAIFMDLYSPRSSFGFASHIPSFLLLTLVLMKGVVSIIPGADLPPPLFVWGLIYYFALFQPTRLSVFMLALSGLVHDVLTGFPIGLSMMSFVLLHGAIIAFGKLITTHNFIATWAGFGVIAVAQGLLTILVITMVTKESASSTTLSVMYGVLLAWIAYPCVHVVSAFVCRHLYKASSFSSR